MITKAQLESLIQREAEKRYKGTPAEHARINTFCGGASLLAPALLESIEAAEESSCFCNAGGNNPCRKHKALQRIKELLEGGK